MPSAPCPNRPSAGRRRRSSPPSSARGPRPPGRTRPTAPSSTSSCDPRSSPVRALTDRLGRRSGIKLEHGYADTHQVSDDTPAPAGPAAGFPLLPWLLATLGIAHLLAAGAAVLPGVGGPATAGLDLAVVVGAVLALVLGRGRADELPFQVGAVALIVLAALASGVRSGSGAHLADGADVVLVVLAAIGLRSRRLFAASTLGALAVWTASAPSV